MGELISARADVGRIEDHLRRALRAARARGGDVAEAAEERLAPAVAAIDGALALLTPAREAEAVAWAAVLAEDAKSDTGIKSLRDAMWNALGRPRQSPVIDLVFPGGVTTYTQPRRPSLSRCAADPGRPRQPFHTFRWRALRAVPTLRSPPYPRPPRVSLHAQARELVSTWSRSRSA